MTVKRKIIHDRLANGEIKKRKEKDGREDQSPK